MDGNTRAKQKKKVVRRKLPLPSDVNTIGDLIHLSQTGVRYANIDMDMLWRIVPQLVGIDSMVGMKELKETLFYQIIFYLQHLIVDRKTDYLHTMILGPPGAGKCLGKDTGVLMYDGSVKCSQAIVPGDLVMGDDSTPRKVLQVCSGVEKMYRIQNRYAVNQSHIISLTDKTCTNFVDISITDYLNNAFFYDQNYYMYKKNVHFPEQPIPIDPYVFGYCWASQYLVGGESFIDISNSFVQKYITSTNCVRYTQNHTFQLTDHTELFDSRLFIPDPFKINHHLILRYVLAGIYDAIGTFTAKERYIVLKASEAPDIIFLHNVLGLYYTNQIRVIDIAGELSSNVHIITLCDLFQIPSYIHETSVHYETTSYTLEPIQVEPLDPAEYYGFELDRNGRFMLQDCLVTHNTTIARIIGELYKQMHILSPNGIFKIAKRDDFVAEYLGQSAIKTRKLLNECIGGILFIDEIYALGPGRGDKDSFSKEAIDTLNLFLSEHSDTFCCIVAGYEDDVRSCFLNVNKGLERRFQWVHRIMSYTPPELVEMFYKLVSEIGWETTIENDDLLRVVKENESLFSHFGGDIENLITKCKMAHSKRIFSMRNPRRFMITKDDLHAGIEMIRSNKMTIVDDRPPFHMYA